MKRYDLHKLEECLEKLGYKYHHTSSMNGYVSRKKDFEIKPYVGKFGLGVQILLPRYDSSRYVFCIYHILDCGDDQLSERVDCTLSDGKEITYYITSYHIGKYDVRFHTVEGYDVVLKKTNIDKIIPEGVHYVCDLNYSNH